MKYRIFGKTQLRTSVFTMGGMRFLPPHVNQEEMQDLIRRGLKLGINHIETARGYGESERLLGEMMADLPREDLIITTKIGPTKTSEEMWRFINESLERMRIMHIDNFDYHGINTFEILEDIKRPDSCRAAVDRAMSEGLIRNVGFSTHGPVEVILAAINTELFSSVNLHYYYFNQRNRPAVERASELGMGVFIISPADKGGQLFAPSAKLTELCAPLHPVVFNARWLLSQPNVHTLSFGPSFASEIEPHIPAFDRDDPLDAQELEILQRLDAQWNTLGADRCSQCYQCLPCPENINIPEVLRLRNMAVAYDMTDFGRYRYKMFEAAGHWFPGNRADKCTDCGDCLPRCPENLPIPTLLRDAHDRMFTGEDGKRMFEKKD